MLKIKVNNYSLYALLLVFISNASIAITAEDRGLEIAIEAKSRDRGWIDNTANMLMLLKNKQGQESLREIKIKTIYSQVFLLYPVLVLMEQ